MDKEKKFEKQFKPVEGESFVFNDEIENRINKSSWEYIARVQWFNPEDKELLKIWLNDLDKKEIDLLGSSLNIDSIDDIYEVIENERKTRKQKWAKEQIKKLKKDFKDKIIQDFISNDYWDIDGNLVDKNALKNKILAYLDNDGSDLSGIEDAEGVFALALKSLVLKQDSEWDKKDDEKKGGFSRILKRLGHGWTVLVNIFQIIVVLAIYESAYYDDDKIIIYSLLILIYTSILSYQMFSGQFMVRMVSPFKREMFKIRELLNDKPEGFEIKELEDYDNAIKKASTKAIINEIFIVIMYAIAVLSLLGVVF